MTWSTYMKTKTEETEDIINSSTTKRASHFTPEAPIVAFRCQFMVSLNNREIFLICVRVL